MNGGVWVLIEHVSGELKESSLMLLSQVRKVADKNKEPLSAVVLGHNIVDSLQTVAGYGPERIFLADHSLLARYDGEAYASVVMHLVNEYQPRIFLFPASPMGSDLAPRVATGLKAGLVSNCNSVEINSEKLLVVTKPVYGGKLWLKATFPKTGVQLATVLPDALEAGEPKGSRKAEIIKVEPKLDSGQVHTAVTGFVRGDPKTIEITDAERIVCAGGGLKEAGNLGLVEELADRLGASIGGSRVTVDKGWLPFSRQIGQTGKTVVPKLIMTFGVSGAIQFTMGMKEAKLIIANDKDRDAPIFKVCDVGVVGDLNEVIPAITKRLGEVSKPGDEGGGD